MVNCKWQWQCFLPFDCEIDKTDDCTRIDSLSVLGLCPPIFLSSHLTMLFLQILPTNTQIITLLTFNQTKIQRMSTTCFSTKLILMPSDPETETDKGGCSAEVCWHNIQHFSSQLQASATFSFIEKMLSSEYPKFYILSLRKTN